ncbi:HAD family acid phosphatase [Streptomyces cinerochromogenes]|uniref:HAD family acid phosphatase n=1 Tax=Streptomyces cinerochromogenes TaxID=66422 RepID=UPI0016716D47|nr:HAD family acid phosphatase [Streptomyces cinerochromogenes]
MTRRPWARRISVTAVSVAALAAMAVPAEAAATSTSSASGSSASASSAKVDHATWQKDCQAVMDQALPYLKDRIAAAAPGEKQAIVLDIDNTALETDFGFSYPQPANKPVLDVARYAQEHGVSLFFVTARPGVLYWPTEYNLEHDGYDVSGLHVRGLLDLFKDVAAYKTAQRVGIENDGYTIIANVGNSATDLSGGHAERTFKLPDYDGQLS